MAKKLKTTSGGTPSATGRVSSKGGSTDSSKLYVSILVGLVALVVGSIMLSPDPKGSGDGKSTRRLTKREIAIRAKDLPCKNKHDDSDCHSFAARGECETAPGWMGVMCAASCDSCDLLDPEIRCSEERIGYTRKPAWHAGSVDELFKDLGQRFPEYNVTYLSTPPEGPWVVKFHNFLSDAEIEAIKDKAGGKLQRSTDQGKFDEDGIQEQVVSKGRTSENAWCDEQCEADPLVLGVMKRIEKVTRVPMENYESFQLLRYRKNQEYNRHHDMSEEDNALLSGPRILTFFLYLSDVEEGGGTAFTDLDPPLVNYPEKGSAILWPSTMNDDPTKMDRRTFHRAMPVIKGTKWAANSWIHLYNYRLPNLWGCTGAFSTL